jgi:hypothetical protein
MSPAEHPGSTGREGGAPETGDSIFGNLPRSRPAVRSPRRAEADAPPEPAADEAAEPAPGPTGGREAEVEALARAGISLAGEAASLGLKVAGRAAAALRGAVERR